MRRRDGYTLVEFLLYIGLTVLLFTFLTDIILSLLNSKAKLQAVNEVTQNTREAMERMQLAIRNATGVTTPAQGATSSQLILTMSSTSTSPTKFFVTSSTLRIVEDAGATTSLTGDEVIVANLLFRNLSATGSPATIRIEVTVSSTDPTADPDYASGQPVIGSATVRQRP